MPEAHACFNTHDLILLTGKPRRQGQKSRSGARPRARVTGRGSKRGSSRAKHVVGDSGRGGRVPFGGAGGSALPRGIHCHDGSAEREGGLGAVGAEGMAGQTDVGPRGSAARAAAKVGTFG